MEKEDSINSENVRTIFSLQLKFQCFARRRTSLPLKKQLPMGTRTEIYGRVSKGYFKGILHVGPTSSETTGCNMMGHSSSTSLAKFKTSSEMGQI